VHHGNGIQDLTFDDPDIFYLSLHRASFQKTDDYFYPGTGRFEETGRNAGVGSNLNIPFERMGMTNVEYAAAFRELVLPALQDFEPDLILVGSGFDAAKGDLLGDCGLSPEMYYTLTKSVLETAGVETPMVVILEGGYNLQVISKCIENVALALLDEPLCRNKRKERESYGGPECLEHYWNRVIKRKKLATSEVTKSAMDTIRKSARALAVSQSRLGAFHCIQCEKRYDCKCTCPYGKCRCSTCGDGWGRDDASTRIKNHKFRRPALIQYDRYPAKKQLLVWGESG